MEARSSRSATERPLLLWDGDCDFCERCVILWRRWLKSQADDCAYQRCRVLDESISTEQLAKRVYLLEPDGSIYSGAAAIYHSLRSTRLSFLHNWYRKSNTFAAVSEKCYAFVARHRSLFSKILAPFLPKKSSDAKR